MPESSPAPESEPESEEVTRDPVTYDSVTVHYQAGGEEPFTVERVIRLADSFFPGSGERALQVIDDPRKGPVGGLFDVDLILIPPEKISHLVLRKGEKVTTVTAEEALSGDAPGFSTSDAS
ncbi:hypothetical protein [Salinibacter altiplanensis]|uniref:hypothetical protein n=1 Tax=Salinibacter altiplanensis TaxID=1803181 RepID=UPI000C9F5078|nr:hypothetical protein [Salinibacter altiplanensis]